MILTFKILRLGLSQWIGLMNKLGLSPFLMIERQAQSDEFPGIIHDTLDFAQKQGSLRKGV
jgi:hypothetical protein